MNRIEKACFHSCLHLWVLIFVAILLNLNHSPYPNQALMRLGIIVNILIPVVLIINLFKNKHRDKYTWLMVFVVFPNIAPLVYLIRKSRHTH